MDQSAELREFLRSRRARLSPEETGIPTDDGRTRRVPGLRREELARLAGVSTDYYTRLEQGRQLNVSESVLDAVARALRLETVERAYLFELARPRPHRAARARPARPQRVRPGVYSMLRMLEGRSPAFVLGLRADVLASNQLARALITDFEKLPHRERNLARFMFLNEAARELYVDWERCAAEMVSTLRLRAGRHPDDRLLTELVGELVIKSPEFRAWWAGHTVCEKTHGAKRFHHPLVGQMIMSYEIFAVPGGDNQSLCVYTAEADSPSEAALQLLANWTSTTITNGTITSPNGAQPPVPDRVLPPTSQAEPPA
jgi:transcriptional regulator with XRE-family HTH domain